MQLPDPKELLKLAKACRKAGITHFKADGFEFSLTEQAPVVSRGRTVNHGSTDKVESDLLSPEELLLWSAPDYGNVAKDES